VSARSARAGAAALLACVCAGAAPQARAPHGTYFLTQAICLPLNAPPRPTCVTQVVTRGSVVQVQVPGTPSAWSVGDRPPRLLVGTMVPDQVPSQGRIAGADEVWIFTFRAVAAGEDTVRLVETPKRFTADGVFRFPIVVR
jgi:hypothetical protein